MIKRLIIREVGIQGGSCNRRILVIEHRCHTKTQVRKSNDEHKNAHAGTTCCLVFAVAVWIVEIDGLTVKVKS